MSTCFIFHMEKCFIYLLIKFFTSSSAVPLTNVTAVRWWLALVSTATLSRCSQPQRPHRPARRVTPTDVQRPLEEGGPMQVSDSLPGVGWISPCSGNNQNWWGEGTSQANEDLVGMRRSVALAMFSPQRQLPVNKQSTLQEKPRISPSLCKHHLPTFLERKEQSSSAVALVHTHWDTEEELIRIQVWFSNNYCFTFWH